MLDCYDFYLGIAKDGMLIEEPSEETIVIHGIAYDQSHRIDALIKSRLIKSMLSYTITYADDFANSIREDPTFHLMNKHHPEDLDDLIEDSLERIPAMYH